MWQNFTCWTLKAVKWPWSTIVWPFDVVQCQDLGDINWKFQSISHLYYKQYKTKGKQQSVQKGVQMAATLARWHICLSLWLWTMIIHFPPQACGIWCERLQQQRVALTHPARVPRTMVAQGHYLHIVKGCAVEGFGEWEIITATKRCNGLWPSARSFCICYLRLRGFCCHINANGRRACRGIMCNYGLNRNFATSNPLWCFLKWVVHWTKS